MAARTLLAAILGGTIVCASSLALPAYTTAEEKQRAPKPKPEETRRKGDEDQQRKEKEEEKSSSTADCLGDIFLNMFCSGSSHESGNEPETVAPPPEEPLPPPHEAPVTPPAGLTHVWQAGDEVVVLAEAEATEVQLWNGPGGSVSGYIKTKSVRDGTHARVRRTRDQDEGETWLEISTLEERPVTGWLSEDAVAWLPARGVTAPAPGAAVGGIAPGRYSEGPAGLVFLGNASWPAVTGPAEAVEEYRDGGWRFGLNAFYVTESSLQFGLGAGYLGMRGYPKYAYYYGSPTRADDPVRSHHYVFDVGLRAGTYHDLLGGRVGWAVGPVLYWVKETATITVRDSASWAPSETRTESLERVRLGGDAMTYATWALGSSLRLGALARAYVIPWTSRGSKSLTLDYVGKKTLAGLELGLVVGFEP
jgi:hypothetical protein